MQCMSWNLFIWTLRTLYRFLLVKCFGARARCKWQRLLPSYHHQKAMCSPTPFHLGLAQEQPRQETCPLTPGKHMGGRWERSWRTACTFPSGHVYAPDVGYGPGVRQEEEGGTGWFGVSNLFTSFLKIHSYWRGKKQGELERCLSPSAPLFSPFFAFSAHVALPSRHWWLCCWKWVLQGKLKN